MNSKKRKNQKHSKTREEIDNTKNYNKNLENTMMYNFNAEKDSTRMYNYNIEEENEKVGKKQSKGKSKVNSKVKGKENLKNKKPKKKKRWKKVLLVFFLLIVLLIGIGIAVIIGILSSDKYQVSREKLIIKNFNSKVVDSEGNVIATLRGDENRKWVSIEDMPEYLPKLFVALEDERFYEHNGVDLKRTLGATLGFIFGKGNSSYGGSTITQQLIKNTFEDKDDSGTAGVQRKIREIARAYNVEKVLSKNEILELYLNKILMGGTYYGVGTAAEYYFSKPVSELSLAECAYFVAINPAPNYYKPFSEDQEQKDKIDKYLKDRLKVVLNKFKEVAPSIGYNLTDEEFNSAMEEVENGLPFQEGKIVTGATNYSYHTAAAREQAIKQLMEEQDLTKDAATWAIDNNGYTIYSTQDSSIQEIMEEEFSKDKYISYGRVTKEDGSLLNEGHTQSAMVIIEPTTGQVVGCMGGLGEDSDASGLNRATNSNKQPGSSIKPLVAVAPALEAGTITAGTVYDDSATSFGGYAPHNSGGYAGLQTVRHAIEHSSNIVNIKILLDNGPSNGAEFLRNMNFDMIRNEEIGPTLALGATSVTPLQMAAGYAMIANDGVYIEPTFYTKVEDSDGNVVFEAKQETKKMMSKQNAYVMKEILTEPVTGDGGTATTCWISGMEVGAKTGSTDDYKDRWLCGITPYYAGACWFGFDNAEVATGISGNGAARVWGEIMRAVHQPLPGARFERPDGIVTATICLDSGCVATDSCERVETEYFVAGTVPSACEGHKKLNICTDTDCIANEHCPNTEEVTFLVKPAKENTTLWSTNDGGKYDIPTEVCTAHKAPDKVEVPNVVGKKQADAKKALEDKGFVVKIQYETNKNKDDGIVLKQTNSGEKVAKGATITITVNNLDNESGSGKTNSHNPKTNSVDDDPPTNTVEPPANTTSHNTVD